METETHGRRDLAGMDSDHHQDTLASARPVAQQRRNARIALQANTAQAPVQAVLLPAKIVLLVNLVNKRALTVRMCVLTVQLEIFTR